MSTRTVQVRVDYLFVYTWYPVHWYSLPVPYRMYQVLLHCLARAPGPPAPWFGLSTAYFFPPRAPSFGLFRGPRVLERDVSIYRYLVRTVPVSPLPCRYDTASRAILSR